MNRYNENEALDKASWLNARYECEGYFFNVTKKPGYYVVSMFNRNSKLMGFWSDSLENIGSIPNVYK